MVDLAPPRAETLVAKTVDEHQRPDPVQLVQRAQGTNCMALIFAVVVVVLGQSAENLSAPLWNRALKVEAPEACNDSFVMFLVMITWYPIMFFVTAVLANSMYRGSPFFFLTKYSFRQHVRIALTGAVDALNGALVIPASPAERTPPIVAALIGCTMLLPMAIIKHAYFKVDGVKVYCQPQFALATFLYLCTAYTIVYPVATRNDDAASVQLGWWIVFAIGMVFGNFYNLQQEAFFKSEGHVGMLHFVEYLFWQTLYLAIVGHLLIGPGLWAEGSIPGRCSVGQIYLSTFYYSHSGWPLVWNATFNFGYYIAYVGACILNKHDALIGVAASTLVTCVVTCISYPIEALTPDKSVVMIGLVPLTIVLSTASLAMYTRWSQKTGIYDISATAVDGGLQTA